MEFKPKLSVFLLNFFVVIVLAKNTDIEETLSHYERTGGCGLNQKLSEDGRSCECASGFIRRLGACIRNLPPKCREPLNKGSWCYGKWRYYFSTEEDQCKRFQYRGCDGNRNNFKTKNACEKECMSISPTHSTESPAEEHSSSVVTTGTTSPSVESCEETPVVGSSCKRNNREVPRWYYDRQRAFCLLSKQIGCHGYATFQECSDACHRTNNICFGYDTPRRECSYSDTCNFEETCKASQTSRRRWCCNTQAETKYREALDRKCADRFSRSYSYGEQSSQGSFQPWMAKTCDQLTCPSGYSCVRANNLFAKCCNFTEDADRSGICDFPCQNGRYAVRDADGCISCLAHKSHINVKCTIGSCPLHCPLSQPDRKQCTSCKCSGRYDNRGLYILRFNVPQFEGVSDVCIDIKVEKQRSRRITLIKTKIGEIIGEFTYHENNHRPFVNFSQYSRQYQEADQWIEGWSLAINVSVQNRQPCICSTSRVMPPRVSLNAMNAYERIDHFQGLLPELARFMKDSFISKRGHRFKLNSEAASQKVTLVQRHDPELKRSYSCYRLDLDSLDDIIRKYEQY